MEEEPIKENLHQERKRALITGITGQDGSYLSELLLKKGYEVYGIVRRSSSFNTGRVNHIFQDPHVENNRFHLHYGDLSDGGSINDLIRKIKPHEVYKFACYKKTSNFSSERIVTEL